MAFAKLRRAVLNGNVIPRNAMSPVLKISRKQSLKKDKKTLKK